jgi:chromosomal replication initiator protein
MEAILRKTNVWDNVLERIENRLNRQIFDSWFLPIRFNGIDEATRTIFLVAGKVTKDWVCLYYSGLIEQIFVELNFAGYAITWQIEESSDPDLGVENESDFFHEQENEPATPLSAAARGIKTTSTHFVDIEPIENSLNPKYTFEKFVVGSCNQFAHAAAKGAAEMPGKTYNPLFLYGGVGLGKTHLMHAIGHNIKERNRHLRVAYITSEKFMNELINAIRYDKTPGFSRQVPIDRCAVDGRCPVHGRKGAHAGGILPYVQHAA